MGDSGGRLPTRSPMIYDAADELHYGDEGGDVGGDEGGDVGGDVGGDEGGEVGGDEGGDEGGLRVRVGVGVGVGVSVGLLLCTGDADGVLFAGPWAVRLAA
jgi:hypothetical protein